MTRTTSQESAPGVFPRGRRPSVLARVAIVMAHVTTVLAVMVGVAACDEGFDPGSKLNSLRILAVQADNPYPQPGDSVQLQMLWHDGKSPPDEPRAVQVVWIAGCFNPLGDLYYGCFPQIGEKLAAAEQDPSVLDKYIGIGDAFSLNIPDDIISSRPQAEGLEPYGLTYLFFAACAGILKPVQPGEDGLPFGCFDGEGNRLGPEDFVPGYMALYSYEKKTNANPVLNGLEINGKLVAAGEEPSFPACRSSSCPTLKLRASVDPASAETNTGLVGADGNALSEQMWVEYLATDGEVDRSPRLINDATKGFNEDNGTDYTPPSDPGKVYVFVVVRDNRGGVAWVKQGLIFE